MHDHGPREDPLTDLGYETRDINIAGLRTTAILFFGFSIMCFVVVAIWLVLAKPQMGSELAPNKPMPEIKLQSNISVRADIASFRQAETQRLSSSGQNPDGSYHMPVDQALDLIAQRGLPHTQTNTIAKSPGNTIPQNAVGPGSSNPAGSFQDNSAQPSAGQTSTVEPPTHSESTVGNG